MTSAKILSLRAKTVLAFLALSSVVTLASCSRSPLNEATVQTGSQFAAAPSAAPRPAAEPQQIVADKRAGAPAEEVSQRKPQLIKKAQLTLVVKSIEESTQVISRLIQKQNGDILGFQSQKPPDSSIRQTASLQIRVPQAQLDSTLNALTKLGTVQNQSLSAEDVTDQIVDSEARLRNLRKSEEMVLKIMERSGSVGDVLKAAQELSQIRESIERIDAQLKSLQNQVAYSSINLYLEATVSATQASQPSLGLRMQETWGKATHSVSELTVSLIAFTLWLFAYSPYLLIVILSLYGFKKLKKNSQKLPVSDSTPPASH